MTVRIVSTITTIAGKKLAEARSDSEFDFYKDDFRSTNADRHRFAEEYGVYSKLRIKAMEKAKQMNPELRDIPTEDLAAVRAYTSKEGYRLLNPPLLRGEREAIRELLPHIRCAVSGLNQLPKYEGVVFRGVDLTEAEAAKYQVGTIVTEPHFNSSTYDKNEMFKGNTEFVIISHNGRRVDSISEYPAEKEVLFRPGTKFRVLQTIVDENMKTKTIIMEEEK